MGESQNFREVDSDLPSAPGVPRSVALEQAVVHGNPEILPTGEEGVAGRTSVSPGREGGRRHLVLLSVIALAVLALAPGAWAFIR
ncbi:MAG: hypothetical protein ACP5O0_10820, partial [Acidimicrobiales bacterium]